MDCHFAARRGDNNYVEGRILRKRELDAYDCAWRDVYARSSPEKFSRS